METLNPTAMSKLTSMLSRADACRRAHRWQEAIEIYRQLADRLEGQAVFHHNLALCHMGLEQYADALAQAERALQANATLWQALIVKVRALKKLGRQREAGRALERASVQDPYRGEFVLERASFVLHEDCNPKLARELVRPWLGKPGQAVDARLTDLVASLYEHHVGADEDLAEDINRRALQFAKAELQRTVTPLQPKPSTRPRLRVGLLSPLFCASPVYFFCVGALRLLHMEYDLYFFSRSRTQDWATRQLQALATEWMDVTDLGAVELDMHLRSHELDVLVDLGGWMDPIGLKALSSKPAARMYKWVGGQSMTTGLSVFDGYITDDAQTPIGFERWYSEPLVRMPLGYVSYTPPPYMPAPVPAREDAHVLGVTANPVKISQPFLKKLNHILASRVPTRKPLLLRFIDKRYVNPDLTERLSAGLAQARKSLGEQLRVEFVVPEGHQEYLTEVGALTEMVDTFPYSGGLTTMEALSLGVPCSGSAGSLFCERHTHAHLRYLQPEASMPLSQLMGVAEAGRPRPSLLRADSPRANHVALAVSLSQLIAKGVAVREYA